MAATAPGVQPLRVCLVGPLPPPAGGMAHQCAQLQAVLRAEGLAVEAVPSNAPIRPAWLARVPAVRALCRLLPYGLHLWRATGRCDLVHVLANSGWAWHLFAAPAIGVAWLRHKPVITHYHGGNADAFLSRGPLMVRRLLALSTLRVVPSAFLQRVFERHGLMCEVIPNGVDLARFGAGQGRAAEQAQPAQHAAPQLLVSRNLERIYGIDTAIRALALVREQLPRVRLVIAGSGAEQDRLQALARRLHPAEAVCFTGRVVNTAMPELLAASACLINPSLVDNMPLSILEAFAAGVPVVSTRAGGVPDLLQHGRSGLLVDVDDDAALAREVLRVLQEPGLAQRLAQAGLLEVAHCAWPAVTPLWLDAYRRAVAAHAARRPALHNTEVLL